MALRGTVVVLVSLLHLGCSSEAALLGAIEADGGPSMDAALGPFGAPTIIPAISDLDADNKDPSMTSDWRELYFMSTRSGNPDIWLSQRAAADAAWGLPSPVTELNTAMDEQSPGVSFDGLTLWFARSMVANQPEIWVATRTALGQTWSLPTAVSALDTRGSQISEKVDEDSLLMFFESSRSGSYALYSSTRPNTQSTWAAPVLLTGLTMGGDAHDPFVASYGLKLWFASTRSGAGDLFSSERASVTSSFAQPIPIPELNTSAAEADPALSPDFRYILFSSNRSGNFQVYQAWR